MTPLVWTKLGRVISPEGAPAWRAGHAGMVSVLPRAGGGYRVYLTGKDAAGRFQVGALDLDAQFRVVADHPGNPLLAAGRMGCFDCQGLCMPTVVRLSDDVLYLYYAGWGMGQPGLFANQCGLAISRDGGATFQRWSEAPLPLHDGRDPIGIGTVFVLRDAPDRWRLWYTTFREWRALPAGGWRHYYHIKYAESADGLHWQKPTDNLAIDFANEREYAIGRPMVLRESDGYRMWFCTRSLDDCYRIGYAESPDGRRWTRRPSGVEPSPSGWDSEMVEYAYVLREPDRYVMFYNGNGYGAAGTGVAVAPAG